MHCLTVGILDLDRPKSEIHWFIDLKIWNSFKRVPRHDWFSTYPWKVSIISKWKLTFSCGLQRPFIPSSVSGFSQIHFVCVLNVKVPSSVALSHRSIISSRHRRRFRYHRSIVIQITATPSTNNSISISSGEVGNFYSYSSIIGDSSAHTTSTLVTTLKVDSANLLIR